MASLSQRKLLLKGGRVLIHDDNQDVKPKTCDILIVGNTISSIEPSISIGVDGNLEVIDCTGKIVSPGFISTHNHLYQTPLKGQHANHTILEYLPTGNLSASLFSVEDAFWGQLSGAMEAVDAGTTTVVDHSSLNLSPEYPKISIEALVTSGLRAVYCYCAPRFVSNWKPLEFQDDYASPWVFDTFESLAAKAPFAGRIEVGFATDAIYLPHDVIVSRFTRLRTASAKLITTHSVSGPAFGPDLDRPSVAGILDGHGLLGPDILLSHANYPPPGTAELLARTGASVSCTPLTELQMGWPPIGLRPEFRGLTSIGVDCHSWGTGYLPGQMRLLLQYARVERSIELEKQKKWSRHVGPTVQDVFNMGTIGGAKAVGMENDIGRLAVGMKADIIVFNTDTPAMLAAADENPVAAVVLHSSERDIEAVIVDGIIRKEKGKLRDVEVSDQVDQNQSLGLTGRTLSWTEIVSKVRESRSALMDRIKAIDMKAAEEVIVDKFYMDRKTLLETGGSN